jgi:hypothetical protein
MACRIWRMGHTRQEAVTNLMDLVNAFVVSSSSAWLGPRVPSPTIQVPSFSAMSKPHGCLRKIASTLWSIQASFDHPGELEYCLQDYRKRTSLRRRTENPVVLRSIKVTSAPRPVPAVPGDVGHSSKGRLETTSISTSEHDQGLRAGNCCTALQLKPRTTARRPQSQQRLALRMDAWLRYVRTMQPPGPSLTSIVGPRRRYSWTLMGPLAPLISNWCRNHSTERCLCPQIHNVMCVASHDLPGTGCNECSTLSETAREGNVEDFPTTWPMLRSIETKRSPLESKRARPART